MINHPDASTLRQVLSVAHTARAFERQISEAFARGGIAGWLHSGLGQELAGAVYGTLLGPEDSFVPYHRSKAALFARGIPVGSVVDEIFGLPTGLNKGRGGEIHLCDPDRHVIGATGILGGGMPVAAGAALAHKMSGSGAIAAVAFGDGVAGEGIFHETLNLTAVWNLPVLFVCENNGYAEMTPLAEHLHQTEIYRLAKAHRMTSLQTRVTDPADLTETLKQAIETVRTGGRPVFVEILTYRWGGHYEGDPQTYRSREEVDARRADDPVAKFERWLIANGAIGSVVSERQRTDADDAATTAVASAEARVRAT